MVVLIIFPVIIQTVINVIMLSIGGQGGITQHKKYELMLTRRVKAYSSSGSVYQLKIGVFMKS